MKKKTAFFAAVTLLSAALLCACGATEEENFTAATEAFDNYTASVIVETVYGTVTERTEQLIEIDGAKGKATISKEPVTATLYFKEENRTTYAYANAQTGWQDAEHETIEETLTDIKCYLGIFQTIYYSETDKTDDGLQLKESMLETYSGVLGFTVKSLKLKLNGDRFAAAEILGTTAEGKVQIAYTFSAFGSTSVTIPE